VTEGESTCLQKGFENRAGDGGADRGDAGDLVEVQQTTQSIQSKGNTRLVCAQAAHNGGASPDRHHGHMMLATHREDSHHLVVTARAHDEVGDIVDRPRTATCIVDEGSPARGRESLRPRVADVLVTDGGAQSGGGGGSDPRRGDLPRGRFRCRPRRRDTDVLGEVVAHAGRQLRGV
jgi:hypothetical protein